MEIRLADVQDIEAWMALVEQVREVFPGLETLEAIVAHRSTVLNFIKNSSGICAEDPGRILGALLFSKESNTLCFLAVDPVFRKQHIAQKMVSFMLTQMPGEKILLFLLTGIATQMVSPLALSISDWAFQRVN